MKKLLFFVTLFMLLLCGCETEEAMVVGSRLDTITASIETATGSKAALQSGENLSDPINVVWEENDAILVFASNTDGDVRNLKYVLNQNDAGKKTGEFYYEGNSADIVGFTLLAAVYPYSDSEDVKYVKSEDDNVIISGLTAENVYNSSLSSKAPMACKVIDGKLTFRNAAALVRVLVASMPEGYSTLEMSSSKQALAGDYSISFNKDNYPQAALSGNTIKAVSVTNVEAGQSVFFPIFAGAYEDLTIKAKAEDKSDVVLVAPKSLIAKRSNVYYTTTNYISNNAANNEYSVVLNTNEKHITLNLTAPTDGTPISIGLEDNCVAPQYVYINMTDPNAAVNAADVIETSGIQMIINLPTSTVLLNGAATYAKIEASTAENTLVLGNGAKVKNLVVNQGNVAVNAGSELDNIDFAEGVQGVKVIDGGGVITDAVKNNPMVTLQVSYAEGGVVYDPNTENYYISTLLGLKWFRDQVDGGNTFADKTVFLTADIDMYEYDDFTQERISFDPIGKRTYSWNGSQKASFNGVFDGNYHTIKNLYQNGWDLDYYSGHAGVIGLFALVDGATIQNLTVEGFELRVEGGNVAAIAGMAVGNSIFKNITVKNSIVCSYNNGVAPIAAWVEGGEFTFEDITIGEDVTVAAFWGTYDASLGGIIAEAYTNSKYTFKNITVNCRLDAYNDVLANYKWYAYRYSGMVVGTVDATQTIGETKYPNPAACNIKCENVEINYGNWMNYHYCVTQNNNQNNYRVESGYSYGGLPENHDHEKCIALGDNSEKVCRTLLPFDQLFGGGQGVYGLKEYEGVTVKYPNTISGTTPSN